MHQQMCGLNLYTCINVDKFELLRNQTGKQIKKIKKIIHFVSLLTHYGEFGFTMTADVIVFYIVWLFPLHSIKWLDMTPPIK